MKLIPLALAFAIGPISLTAQSAAPATIASPSNFNIVIGSDCPLSMQLEQRLGDRLATVQNDGRVYKAPATQLMLTIAPASSASFGQGVAHPEGLDGKSKDAQPASRVNALHIVSATATAYGFGSQPRAELVSPGPNSRRNASSVQTRNLQLQFSAKDGSSIAEVWVPAFGAVRSLELQSITWSDGSNWKPARGESCTVAPSLFMLVGANSSIGKAQP